MEEQEQTDMDHTVLPAVEEQEQKTVGTEGIFRLRHFHVFCSI